MAREHARFLTPEHPCSYLVEETAVQEVRLLTEVSPVETEALISRGWRRFGAEYFRPRCQPCGECVSLRVPTETFQPSKAQRRVARKCAGVEVMVGSPVVDEERVALYHKWHRQREVACGWRENVLDAEGYQQQFCFPHPCAREMTYRVAGQLMGVGLVDVMPGSLSSIYFFFDPEHAQRSPGVFSALCEIALARQAGKKYVYFGYRVAGCKSVAYKAGYRPHELLVGRPGDEEEAEWVGV